MYHKASGRLYSIQQDFLDASDSANGYADTRFMLPTMMISSFASELYFKSLYAIEHAGATTDQHDLMWFYNRLAPQTKKLVQRHWNEVANADANMQHIRK